MNKPDLALVDSNFEPKPKKKHDPMVHPCPRYADDPLDAWCKRVVGNKSGDCKKNALSYNLTGAWVLYTMKEQDYKCFYCFHPFSLSESPRHRCQRHQPTLDRVKPGPAVGYTQDNVVIACNSCNNLKSDGQVLEFERLARGIRKHMKEERQ